MPRRAYRSLLCLCGLALGWISGASAAEFVISPLQVTLSRAAKSAQIEVRNVDTQPLRVELQAMAWSQDAEGNDHYVDSDGLLYFPRAMEIPAGGTRIVRLAARVPAAGVEDTYRLFIAELPRPDEAGGGSASVRVLLRVGVAVFVHPVAPKAAVEFAPLELRRGSAGLTVRNAGNVHIAADRLALVGFDRDGKRLFEIPLRSRYFLAGTSKRLSAQIPGGQCRQLAALEAVLVGSGVDLKRRLDVSPADCN